MTVDTALELAAQPYFGDLGDAARVLAAEVRRLREENEALNDGLTVSYMHGYDKAKEKYEQHLAEAVRECERIAMQTAASKSIGRQQGKHHEAGAQHAASAIRNRWPGYFKPKNPMAEKDLDGLAELIRRS